MLNKYYRGFAVAMLAMALGVPAYSQPINRASVAGIHQAKNITISINDISAENAIGLICDHFGYTPMFHMPLNKIVSLDIANATFDEAMESVLANTQTDYMVEGGRLHVFKPRESWSKFSEKNVTENANAQAAPQQPKQEEVITKIIPLGKRTAADIQKLVKELNPRVSAVYDAPTNAVVIMGPESQVVAIETLCKNIDTMEVKQTAEEESKLVKGLRYVTKTFELEHADFEEIEKELSTMIERDDDSGSSSSSSSAANLRDKDGNPIETEYFMMDKARRIVVVHTTVEKLAVVDEFFKAIDKPLPQVLIEASILAVNDQLEKQLGIKWDGLDGDASNKSGYFAPEGKSFVSTSLKDHFKLGGAWNFEQVAGLLRAVEKDDKSEILSRPRVVTVTGKTSSIHVGDEIPYTSGTTMNTGGNSTSSISFKEVGIKLDVTPVVNSKDGSIQLTVIPEVSQWVKDVVMGNNTVPQVSTRRSESTVKIMNGETMIIGGLIENSAINGVNEVPLLSKIPLVGRAFRNKKRDNDKTNLIILVTARLIDDNFRNIVDNKALKEFNEVKPMRHSQAIDEMSKAIYDSPSVYGKNIEWPKVDETKVITPVKARTRAVEKPVEKTEGMSTEEYLRAKLVEIRANMNE